MNMLSLDIAAVLVQFALVATAAWYSYETRQLRLQNLEEIRLLKKQGLNALAPYLLPGAQRVSVESLVEYIQADNDLNDDEKLKKIQAVKKEDVFIVVVVKNSTSDKIGCHLEPYIYDLRTKSFLTPDHGKETISPKSEEHFQVTGPYANRQQVEKKLVDAYGDRITSLFGELHTPDDEGYIALFFQDTEGNLYLSKRPFVEREGQIVHHRSSKIYSAAMN
ncbi:MAG: hypothetical protein VBE63_22075 [Lamprobacter sp.]|uniref:hypothetical protein n=1 Tax=Lamprobacter sp. TaxID=3100796 RepID=UPI002B263919|nr:hypothetical protein [Lamprobacter sp.]MEA3642606.1 hypothetical protein [Lamprobacter sp.]